jgi:hypothetical protein
MTLIRERIDHLYTSLLRFGNISIHGLRSLNSNLAQLRLGDNSDFGDLQTRDLRIRNLFLEGLQSGSRAFPDRRQCVLCGPVNASGLPDLFTVSGSSLQILFRNSTDPLQIAFANGYDAIGQPLDYVFSTNVGSVIVPASSTSYIYADRSPSTGNVIYGRSGVVPVYQDVAPASPATDQHWFDTSGRSGANMLSTYKMWRWEGSGWEQVQRVFLGEAVSNASGVTSAITYAYRRSYVSAWTAAAAGNSLVFNHNLGFTTAQGKAMVALMGRTSGGGSEQPCQAYYVGGSGAIQGVLPYAGSAPRTSHIFLLGNQGYVFNGGWITSGQAQACIHSTW